MGRHSKGRAKSDHRADTRGGALSGLPHCVQDSAAFLSLSPFERAVHAEIVRRFNGYNNGRIVLSYAEIGARLRGLNRAAPNNGRIGRAVAQLIDRGLIAEPTPGSWLQRKAREYRLTWISSGNAPPFSRATNEYLQWQPATKAKNARDVSSPEASQSDDAAAPEPTIAGDSAAPANLEIGSFPSQGDPFAGDAPSLLICKPYPPAENTGVCGIVRDWWESANGKQRVALAHKAGITPGELKAFVANDIDLDIGKQMALRTAIAGPTGRAA